jgi:hypothetical protein
VTKKYKISSSHKLYRYDIKYYDGDSWEKLESKDMVRYEEGMKLLKKRGIKNDLPPKEHFESFKGNSLLELSAPQSKTTKDAVELHHELVERRCGDCENCRREVCHKCISCARRRDHKVEIYCLRRVGTDHSVYCCYWDLHC